MTKPRQGVYLGEAGSSQILMVDKVYDDTVRTIFSRDNKVATADKDEETAESTEETAESADRTYGAKELSYYASTEEVADPEEEIQIVKRHEFA
ncbi:MAG: hypothetical protein WCL71_03580 [Deltaproteobacteria bacterium]